LFEEKRDAGQHEELHEGFRSVAKFPAPGALSRARALLLELAPDGLAIPFDDWASLASICDTAWLAATRRPSVATARIVRRRLRLLASPPAPFAVFATARGGDGPLHVRGTCAALPGHETAATLWRVDAQDDPAGGGRILIEEARDFLLAVGDGGYVYVLSKGGHLVSTAPLRIGDTVSVFGFADQVPDRTGLASAPHGRGGFMPAIRSGAELPLLLTHPRGEPASFARRVPSREGSGTL
jgi:hypothetical protein